jgi:hypothetical protein
MAEIINRVIKNEILVVKIFFILNNQSDAGGFTWAKLAG